LKSANLYLRYDR